VAGAAGGGDLKPPVVPFPSQAHRGQPAEARPVFQPGRPAQVAAQHQPVQGGAAARLQVGLFPHSPQADTRDADTEARRRELPAVATCGRKSRTMRAALTSAVLPLLRRLDPERAHTLALRALRLGLGGGDSNPDDPILAQTTFGLRFRNPIGLAAGFDKDAAAARPLMALGFGFVEVGTVTPKPQPGNPRPRLFRLAEDQAVINRMGFNGEGLDHLLRNLAGVRAHPVPLGVNVGLNKDGGDAERDYPALVAAVAPCADYVAINVSSPNTPGLRDLQAADRLRRILQAIDAAVPKRPPLLVKIAPDLAQQALEDAIAVCVAANVDGLIVGNTTLDRPPQLRSRYASEAGGLSGAPLFARSTAMLARAHEIAGGRLVLIGCGGVFSGRDALAKIRAGASLVQLYTAFAYHGPALIPRLKSELAAALRADGFARLTDAIGVDARQLAESPCNT
jgi:dihydroorotate dehydrogenase